MTIHLQEKDKHILLDFKNELKYTGKLYYINRQKEKDAKRVNRSNQYRLQVKSRRLSTALEKIGCVPRKSLILKFPSTKIVPKNLQHHFIRGYFDGDGCISIPTKEPWKVAVSLCGSYSFIEVLKYILSKKCGVALVKTATRGKIYVITYGGRINVKSIQKYMYKDCKYFLKRKYNKFYEIHYTIKGFEK